MQTAERGPAILAVLTSPRDYIYNARLTAAAVGLTHHLSIDRSAPKKARLIDHRCSFSGNAARTKTERNVLIFTASHTVHDLRCYLDSQKHMIALRHRKRLLWLGSTNNGIILPKAVGLFGFCETIKKYPLYIRKFKFHNRSGSTVAQALDPPSLQTQSVVWDTLALSELNELDGPGSSDGAAIAKLTVLRMTAGDQHHPTYTIGSQPKRSKVLLSSNRMIPFLKIRYDASGLGQYSTDTIKLSRPPSGKISP
ncbi:hypothetical protein EDB19DRAFT_1833784 [Suillus lakei]|nr:hypothetical protein EDB19DRAFT_1833784 [Suillus lakei]